MDTVDKAGNTLLHHCAGPRSMCEGLVQQQWTVLDMQGGNATASLADGNPGKGFFFEWRNDGRADDEAPRPDDPNAKFWRYWRSFDRHPGAQAAQTGASHVKSRPNSRALLVRGCFYREDRLHHCRRV